MNQQHSARIVVFGATGYPFAKLTWNELRNFLMGDDFLIANAIVVLFFKLVINLALWSLAIFIAPIGVAYLWLRTRNGVDVGAA